MEHHKLVADRSQDNHHSHSPVQEVGEELAVAMVRLGADLGQIYSRLDGLAAKVEARSQHRGLVAPAAMEQGHQSAVWPMVEYRHRHRRRRRNLLDHSCLAPLQYDQRARPRDFLRVLA